MTHCLCVCEAYSIRIGTLAGLALLLGGSASSVPSRLYRGHGEPLHSIINCASIVHLGNRSTASHDTSDRGSVHGKAPVFPAGVGLRPPAGHQQHG